MLFNSIEFLFFLPLVFTVYWLVLGGGNCKNIFIVATSYVFYGWWDWRFLFLMALTTFCSYFSGILLAKYDTYPLRRKWICGGNILLNLLILGYFKYYNVSSK